MASSGMEDVADPSMLFLSFRHMEGGSDEVGTYEEFGGGWGDGGGGGRARDTSIIFPSPIL